MAFRKAGGVQTLPAEGRRCIRSRRGVLSLLLPGLLALILCSPASAAIKQGTRITATGELTWGPPEVTPQVSRSTVEVAVSYPTRAVIEALAYGGGAASPVPQTYYRNGDSGELLPLAAPVLTGRQGTPLDLSQPLPLSGTGILHGGDPLFIRLTDLDRNQDPTVAETVEITLTTDGGDREVLRLTETGPDTGVFVGYIQTVKTGSSARYDGLLYVSDKTNITASYTGVAGDDLTASVVLVDPYGIVFDSATGAPVDGATITLKKWDDAASEWKDAPVKGDDGIAAYPATVVTGSTAADNLGRRYSFPPGGFRFPFVSPGRYRLDIVTPTGYAAPSTVPEATLRALLNGAFTVVTGASFGGEFEIQPGPALHVDIPVDPVSISAWVTKSAGKTTASVGEFIPYTVTVENPDPRFNTGRVVLTDRLPAGFHYRSGSAKSEDGIAEPEISADGRTLTFRIPDLLPKARVTVRYVVQVGAGAKPGEAVNTAAVTTSGTGRISSNTARATVIVQEDLFRSRSILMGKVFRGPCNLDWDEGVEGVRIYLEDGTFVTTDKRGMFHFEGVLAGTHVVQLDLDSLPEGFEVYSCEENTRFAGRAYSQFVDLQGGGLWRVDFRAGKPDDQARYEEKKAAAERAAREEAEKAERLRVEEEAKKKVVIEEKEETVITEESVWAEPAVPENPQEKEVSDDDVWSEKAPGAAPVAQVAPVAAAGPLEAFVELQGAVAGGAVAYTVTPTIGAEQAPAAIVVELPAGLVYRSGSASFAGRAVSAAVQGRELRFDLGTVSEKKPGSLAFTAEFAPGAPAGEYVTRALLRIVTSQGNERRTRFADSVVLHETSERKALPAVTLYPNFATFSASLTPQVEQVLEEALRQLAGAEVRGIKVVGHTDTVRIAPRSRNVYRDNTALSLARARTVAAFLQQRLKLAPAAISVAGSGEHAPVASNRTAAGRAKNRRVEVMIVSDTASSLVKNRVIRGSGPQPLEEEKRESAPAAPVKPAVHSVTETSVQAAAPVLSTPAAAVVAEPPQEEGEELLVPFIDDDSDFSVRTAESASGEWAVGLLPDFPWLQRAAAVAPLPEKAEEKETRITETGFVYPRDGSSMHYAVAAVRVVVPTDLVPTLTLDGAVISQERVGLKLEDPKTGNTLYSYIGVDFGLPGEHTLAISGKDSFGISRFEQKAKVMRTGRIAAIKVLETGGNVADGKTPVRMKVALFDVSGGPVNASVKLGIQGDLKGPSSTKVSLLSNADSDRVAEMTPDGTLLFAPVSKGGLYRVVLSVDDATLETSAYVSPKLRDLVLVGLAEGTAGYNMVSGSMERLKGAGVDNDLYENGRIAFFAKGKVLGAWLLTMAYDSEKKKPAAGNGMFQTIDPSAYYTVYGDASRTEYDASSMKKLYLRMERDQFYALFGDMDTGLSVTELARYSRRLTGLKSELQTKDFEYTAFAAPSEHSFVRDEIAGDGTSGLYRLTRRPIALNSETVVIEARDRFRSEIVLTRRQLSRYTDYSIDYDSGTLLFKEPVSSRDSEFNPQVIVVEYEAKGGGQAITFGGRAGIKLQEERVKAGATFVRQADSGRRGELYGVDTLIRLTPQTQLRAEYAYTDAEEQGETYRDSAYLTELTYRSKRFDGRGYVREQGNHFGLGQQRGTESGTRKFGAESAYRLTDTLLITAQGWREESLSTAETRKVAEAKAVQTEKGKTVYGGVRFASDRTAAGDDKESTQLVAGASAEMLERKLTLKVDHSQSLGANANADFPTRTIFGADYRLFSNVMLQAQHEMTWGKTQSSQNTRLGAKSTPWSGGELYTSMEQSFTDDTHRLFGNLGLRQRVTINPKWDADAGLERTQTIIDKRHYAQNSLSSAAPAQQDFTAFSLGTGYKEKLWAATARFEYRTSDAEDKFGILASLLSEPETGWACTARLQLFDTMKSSGEESLKSDIRLGTAYRPALGDWIFLDRLDFIVDNVKGTPDPYLSWRVVNNFNANWKPASLKRLQLSLQYGAKYVSEAIDGDDYAGFNDLIGVEGRYDLTRKVDVGLRTSILHSWGFGEVDHSSGVSVGYNVMENGWVSLGYNLTGFSDRDFSAANYTAQGPFVQYRFKFDQNSVKDAAKWINSQ